MSSGNWISQPTNQIAVFNRVPAKTGKGRAYPTQQQVAYFSRGTPYKCIHVAGDDMYIHITLW